MTKEMRLLLVFYFNAEKANIFPFSIETIYKNKTETKFVPKSCFTQIQLSTNVSPFFVQWPPAIHTAWYMFLEKLIHIRTLILQPIKPRGQYTSLLLSPIFLH